MRELCAQPGDHLVGAELCARSSGFSAMNMRAGVDGAAVAAGECDHIVDRRIGIHDLDEFASASAASPETKCPGRPASMPIRRPVSCCGKNPLGMT